MPHSDPRTPHVAVRRRSVNEELLDRSILHATLLERLKTTHVRGALGFLNRDVFPELISLLQRRLDRIRLRGFDSGVHTTQRFRRMIAEVGVMLTEGMDGARRGLIEDLRELGVSEADWAAARLRESVGPFVAGVQFTRPPKPLLRSIASGQAIRGLRLGGADGWFRDLANSTKRAIAREVGIGMAIGETTDQLVRRVRGGGAVPGVLNRTRRSVEAIVRTSVNHVSNQAREATYEQHSDVVKGVIWISTLDSRTTQICIDLDGTVFPLGEGERPPAHVNCRSTTAPVTKSWSELGIDLNEAPEGTRASMDGQVPGSITYKEWILGQPAAIQNEVLGLRRAQLMRSGRVPVDRFFNSQHRFITLEDLRRIEGLDGD